MHTSLRVRAAAVLLLGALAACADAPTAPLATAENAPAALSSHPAPTLSVSNSGGYPLISWAALSGATSYSVSLLVYESQTNRETAESVSWTDVYPLGSTTGTSYWDTAHAYTGVSRCSYTAYPWVTRITYRYQVVATFADGTSESFIAAPVAQC